MMEIIIIHYRYYLNELIYSTEIESKTEIIEETESKVVQEDAIPSVLPLMID